MRDRMRTRKEVLPVFLILMVMTSILFYVMLKVQPYLIENHHYILSFGEIASYTAEDNWKAFLIWYVAEIAEPVVSRTVPAAIGMTVFALFGEYLEKRNSKFRGTDIVGGSGLFRPIFIMSLLSLLICDLLYHRDAQYGFVPTFISVCTIIPFTAPRYGYKGIPAVTQIVMAGVLPYLFARIIMFKVTEPLHLPRAMAGLAGILLSTIAAEEILKVIPWMKKQDLSKYQSLSRKTYFGTRFFVERLLADPNEMSCWGSSWSTIGMYLGGIIAWVLNPNASSNLEGMFPVVMCCQLYTVLLSIFIFYPSYKKGKQAFTFTGYVVISSVINTYTPSVGVLVLMIILSAVLAPVVTSFFVKHVKRWKFVSIQILMGIITATVILSEACQILNKIWR